VAKVKSLRDSPYFKSLNDKEIGVLSQVVEEKTLPPGTTLFLEGMLGESMYIVVSGKIKIAKMISEGEEKVLVVLGPGDNFGEMAILDGGPRAATAVASEPTQILTLKRNDFAKLQEKDPAVAIKVLWALVKDFSRRIRENAERYKDLLNLEVPKG
jgi:CRP/FNR family cyclic AMP-dependent transcriptional regulator